MDIKGIITLKILQLRTQFYLRRNIALLGIDLVYGEFMDKSRAEGYKCLKKGKQKEYQTQRLCKEREHHVLPRD
jgi:hypothetical protein